MGGIGLRGGSLGKPANYTHPVPLAMDPENAGCFIRLTRLQEDERCGSGTVVGRRALGEDGFLDGEDPVLEGVAGDHAVAAAARRR